MGIDTFLREKAVKGAKANSIRSYRSYLKKLQRHAEAPLEELTRDQLLALLEWIPQHYTGGGIVNAKRFLKHYLRWAKYPHLSLIQSGKMPARVETADLLTPEDIQDMLETTQNPMHRAFIALLADSAARRQELCNLQLKDILVDGPVVLLRVMGKGQRVRRIPIRNSVPTSISGSKSTHANIIQTPMYSMASGGTP